MKKHIKHRKYPGHNTQPEPDIAGMISKIQEQLFSLEKKIDALASKPLSGPAEVKHFSKPFQQHGHTHDRGGGSPEGRPASSYRGGGRPEGRSAESYRGGSRQDNNYRERTLHKAICADCRKECEVPFKPSGDRPVYCKECFSKRKVAGGGSPEGRPTASHHGGGSFRERPDNRRREARPGQEVHADKPHDGEKKRYSEHKKPAAKRRKGRAGL